MLADKDEETEESGGFNLDFGRVQRDLGLKHFSLREGPLLDIRDVQ